MGIKINIIGDYKKSGLTEVDIKSTVEAVFKYLKKDKRVNIKIAADHEMQELNQQYRGKDETTDILSFNYDDDADIILDLNTINRLKEDLETLSEATQKTIIHGVLHLFGFNHENEEDRAIMEEAENKIFNKLK